MISSKVDFNYSMNLTKLHNEDFDGGGSGDSDDGNGNGNNEDNIIF